jgi:hypothetical protein
VDEIRFEEFGKTTDYTNWDKGRLFGKEAELKWHRRDGFFHLVVITDSDSLPQGFTGFKCSNLHTVKDDSGTEKPREIFLWGEKDRKTGSWFEPRIPRLLHYPGVDFSIKKKRVKVVLREYTFEETPAELEEQITSNIYRFVRLIQAVDEES